MAEMWQLKPLLLLIAVLLGALACTVAGDGGMPLVIPITKDADTLLYSVSAPVAENDQITNHLVLDLSGPIIWSTCPDGYVKLGCTSPACMQAHRFHPPNCPQTGYGKPDADNPHRCKCTAHPHNPVSGDTASDDMTEFTTSVNTTDGKNPLKKVSFVVATSCAPESLLAGLPENDVGVVGLGRSALALPAQIADTQKVSNKFALCLPSGGSDGVAIFGGGPLFLLPPGRPDVVATLAGDTPLVKHGRSPGYFISADKGIAVNQAQVQLDGIGYGATPLVVGLSSTTPYTELRSDVYWAFITAFNMSTAERARVTPAVAPFELCYDSTQLGSTRLGYAVPQIDLMLEVGKNWTIFGANSMAQVNDHTACLAFVEMKGEHEQYGYGGGATEAPAVVIGGFQMENNLLVFDEENQRLGFSSLLFGRQTTCSNFNFTMAA
ncbi:hypothetical protein ACQ4PT_060191 [Festuca glaucescens]